MRNKDNERRNRSEKYQYLIVEFLVNNNDIWESFEQPHDRSFTLSLEKIEYLRDLDEQLHDELINMLKTCLTKRQYEVISLYMEGYTQMEIAKMLCVNQSSITKSLNGNVDYKNGRKIYGGSQKKMANLIAYNEKLKPIMAKIYEVWEPGSLRLPHYQTFRNLLGNDTEFEAWLEAPPLANLKRTKRRLYASDYQTPGLTLSEIIQLRQKAAEGVSIEDLCKEFKCKKSRVKKILESK